MFDVLYEGMQLIKARETLNDFTKHDWSQMKTQDRMKLHRKIYRFAYPNEIKKSAVTTDKLNGIGVITPEMIKNG